MIFCRHCRHQIHETARNCPSCGGAQVLGGSNDSNDNTSSSSGWTSIASLIFGIFSIVVWFDDSAWDADTFIGVFAIFILPAFVLGVVSLSNKFNGRGMAISGLVMSLISIVMLLSS